MWAERPWRIEDQDGRKKPEQGLANPVIPAEVQTCAWGHLRSPRYPRATTWLWLSPGDTTRSRGKTPSWTQPGLQNHEQIISCYFNPLSFGLICYTVVDNWNNCVYFNDYIINPQCYGSLFNRIEVIASPFTIQSNLMVIATAALKWYKASWRWFNIQLSNMPDHMSTWCIVIASPWAIQ